MLFPKLITLVAVLVSTLGLLWFQRHSVARQDASNTRLQRSITAIEAEIGALEKARPVVSASTLQNPPLGLPQPTGVGGGAGSDASSRPNVSAEVPFVTLSKATLKQLELAPVTEEFKLTDEVCAVLGVSPSERAIINQATAKLISTQQQMDVSRLQKIDEHLTTDEGRKTTFKVPAYPQEGRQLADQLIAQVQAALGQERTELLLGYADLNSLSAEGYEPFGRTEKLITFLDRENPDGTRADCKVYMKVTDSVTGLSLSTSFANRDDAIPHPWRHLIENAAPQP